MQSPLGDRRGVRTPTWERLGRRYEEVQGFTLKALKIAKTPEEQKDVRNRRGGVLLNELLRLEEKERGRSAGIGVLHWILSKGQELW